MQFTGLLLQFTTTSIIVYSFNSHFQLNWGQTVHHIFLLLVALYFTVCYLAPVHIQHAVSIMRLSQFTLRVMVEWISDYRLSNNYK